MDRHPPLPSSWAAHFAAIVLAATLAVPGAASAAGTDGWKPMDPTTVGPRQPVPGAFGHDWLQSLQDNTVRRINDNGGRRVYMVVGHETPLAQGEVIPATVYSASFDDGDRRIQPEVMLGPQGYCDNGPNSSLSTRNYAKCPGHVVVTRGDRQVVIPVRSVCVAPPDANNPDDRTYARYDASRHQVLMTTYNGKRSVQECQITIPIPVQ